MSALWTREEALRLCKSVEATLREYGWHVALAGSVLHRGRSNKDLDLVVFPRKKPKRDRRALRTGLEACGFHRVRTRAWMLRNWASRGIFDTKWVEVWGTHDGRRIDLLVLS